MGLADLSQILEAEHAGTVDRGGVGIHYEVHGTSGPTVVLLPSFSIIHSRMWKAQVPYLARHVRVITFDGRGNGRTDRPVGSEAYAPAEFALDTLAVMDATGTERATLVAVSCGAMWATILAADYPERVERVVYIAAASNLAPGHPERAVYPFEAVLDTDEGWAKDNADYWRRDFPGYLEFFFEQCLSEPHSTKQIEDCVSWGLDTSAETLIDVAGGTKIPWDETYAESCARVRCPVLVIHGDDDRIRPLGQGAALADATGGTLVTLRGAGHLPMARDPVKCNELLRDFIAPRRPSRVWTRAALRPPRALFISSPIGLGHARRDLAIARELRRRQPDLQIEWLAQHPVTVMLEEYGEAIHPLSGDLAAESAHIAAAARGHQLPVFDAVRDLDELFVANFMVFLDVVREQAYDLWIGDEAWEVDYFLHENPELKTAPYVWMSDFVGWLPMAEGGDREAYLTADLNQEMIEQRARFPRLRDRSIFVGEPDDIVPARFGPQLPEIREWAQGNFSFSGYVLGAEPPTATERDRLRAQCGYRPDERVCLVAVGGSGVGADLLERVASAYDEARGRVPDLRMVLAAGPRIDPASLSVPAGVEVRGYVPRLDHHLAACDLAVVQGGLATTMELAAAGRPFLYVPLARHFEQQIHVAHRLDRYGVGHRVAFDEASPSRIADVIANELVRPVTAAPIPRDGAARAAAMIAELL